MNILISGSTGLIGSALAARLVARGDIVLRLTRGAAPAAPAAGWIYWEPAAGRLDSAPLEGLDAAIHLSGENLAARRWTVEQKERIRKSRVESTALLARTLAGLRKPPRVWITASAVGYYGDRGDEILREESPPGVDFLAEVCRAWEGATAAAWDAGIRVVQFRHGIVLAPEGGALAQMTPLFRLGLGGSLGNGRQWVSWIALDDLVAAEEHALAHESLRGAVNAVAPNPVTNAEFTRALARTLRRPALLPVPAIALKAAVGELAGALLASQRAVPAQLLESGFSFRYPRIEDALGHALGAAPAPPARRG